MHPPQQSLAFQLDEVLADGFAGDAQFGGDVGRLDAAVAAQRFQQVLFALIGVEKTGGFGIMGTHARPL